MTYATPRLALLLTALLALGWGGSGCTSEAPSVGVTVSDINEDPNTYIGRQVTVSGEVDAVYPNAFTIGGEGFGEELLVIVPAEAETPGGRSGPMAYQEDDLVQVDGTVRPYAVSEIEEDLALDLSAASAQSGYAEQAPAVVATAIRITQREDPLVEEDAEANGIDP